MKKTLKTIGKVLLILLIVLVLIVAGYFIYIFASYHRLEDNLPLTADAPADGSSPAEALTTGETYTAITYNVGFGAYLPDYSFFMDGGESSWAASKESAAAAITGAAALADSYDPDFVLFQEIDIDATRTYHLNEYALMRDSLSDYTTVFAQNYDSAFLFYPLTEPHGANQSGIATFSKYEVTSAIRRSLPISTSFSKLFDLDRCYSISRMPVDNGRELVLFDVHLSAYGSSDEIREGQLSTLCADMKAEVEAGNYVLAGGDFNHDLKADEDAMDDVLGWAYPFSRSSLPEGIEFAMDRLTDAEKQSLWNSCRNADEAYNPETTYTVTVDGFLISDNIEMVSYENVNSGYSYSDHDPVVMEFILN